MTGIEERYARVQERIARAAGRAGRPPEEITLVAVTKTWPAEVVMVGYRAGLRHFGENRVEELAPKRAAVVEELGSGLDIVWHLIGTLQSRKTSLAAENADVFHALDREKVARRLSTRLAEMGRELPVFIEVNVSGEASKSGIFCGDWQSSATQREHLRRVVETVTNMPGLTPRGLMTMAPWNVEERVIREVFRSTRLLAEWLQSSLSRITFDLLSMGMTDDFEIAIEEGATHVRIGRALFGQRT